MHISITAGIFIFLSCLQNLSRDAAESATERNQPNDDGIIYFSYDNGVNWVNKSAGLPENFSLTDIAVADNFVALSTKQNGVFKYDFRNNTWQMISDHSQFKKDADAILISKGKIFIGTNGGGIFFSDDNGTSWTTKNNGLKNLLIRRITAIGDKLYAGTNDGLYSLNEKTAQWTLEFRRQSLQVNGITQLDNEIYIGTNQGAFKSVQNKKNWDLVLPHRSLHNIGSDGKSVYAMVYNELLSSADHGKTWQSGQQGLPADLYTFQIVEKDNVVFAGQWDGVYKMNDQAGLPLTSSKWLLSSKGLPSQFAVTEMKVYRNILIVGCSERKLTNGLTTNK